MGRLCFEITLDLPIASVPVGFEPCKMLREDRVLQRVISVTKFQLQ